MNESQIASYITIITGIVVLGFHIKKLWDAARKRLSMLMGKIKDAENRRTKNISNANAAVDRALEAWNYAENYREAKSEYVQAYGGYYPTVQEEIECWEDAFLKCKRAVTALEQNNETERARWFSRNVAIATKRLEGLRCNANNGNARSLVIGIDEAKRRKYDAELANSANRSFVSNWKVFSNADVIGDKA